MGTLTPTEEASILFKEKYRDLQELVRELFWLRSHNLKIKEGAPQQELLLFAEAALVLMTLERFLRILPGVVKKEKDTLFNLLESATSVSLNLLTFPANITRTEVIKKVTDVRNAILHGNFEQVENQAGAKNKEQYFKTNFAADIEDLTNFTNGLFAQIDPETGNKIRVK